jgi:hypothetical protein
MTLFAVWSASLLGSGHCLGMCGPIAVGTARTWQQIFAYNLARGLAYVFLGLAVGFVGESLLDFDSSWLRIVSTILMVISVLFISWRISTSRPLQISLPVFWLRWHRSLFKKFTAGSAAGEILPAFSIGALTAALPCGWLYTFVLLAAASGSALRGGLILAAFWLGTLPVMAMAPALTKNVLVPLQRKSPRILGAAVATASLFAIWLKWASLNVPSCH